MLWPAVKGTTQVPQGTTQVPQGTTQVPQGTTRVPQNVYNKARTFVAETFANARGVVFIW